MTLCESSMSSAVAESMSTMLVHMLHQPMLCTCFVQPVHGAEGTLDWVAEFASSGVLGTLCSNPFSRQLCLAALHSPG